VADSNAGSSFGVTEVVTSGGWARVAPEQMGVPREEAVGFGVYLRKADGARWEVVTTGTGLSAEELPGAPAGLFEP
jgi:hypothetical protein